jgi:hypothetical protein
MKGSTMPKTDCLKRLSPPSSHKRTNITRTIKPGIRGESAQRTIGQLTPGCEIYGFTKGQFSCIHILEHVLKQTGPADVTICTWSAASGDISAAHNMLHMGGIDSLRFIVDFSFKSRKPKFCQELIDAFGPDAIRVTSIHAKFMVVRNEAWSLCIRTSMNLNHNPRFENFEISDDAAMCDFMLEIVDEIWRTQQPLDGFKTPSDGQKSFKGFSDIDQSNVLDDLVAARPCDMVAAKPEDLR